VSFIHETIFPLTLTRSWNSAITTQSVIIGLLTDIPTYSITRNTGSSSYASSATGIYSDVANESRVHADVAFYTNALEGVQQEIGEEATSLRPKNTDMAYKSEQLEFLDWWDTLSEPEIARPHTPATMCADARGISNPDWP
jgi:hypothetical protein